MLHWAQGADGQGALLTGDTLQVRPDKGLTFMHSYPNLIPLDAATVSKSPTTLEPWPFETIYGGWWERVIPHRGKAGDGRVGGAVHRCGHRCAETWLTVRSLAGA